MKGSAEAAAGLPGATVLVTYSVILVLTIVVEVRYVMVGVLRNVILISFVIVLGITVSLTTASLVTTLGQFVNFANSMHNYFYLTENG